MYQRRVCALIEEFGNNNSCWQFNLAGQAVLRSCENILIKALEDLDEKAENMENSCHRQKTKEGFGDLQAIKVLRHVRERVSYSAEEIYSSANLLLDRIITNTRNELSEFSLAEDLRQEGIQKFSESLDRLIKRMTEIALQVSDEVPTSFGNQYGCIMLEYLLLDCIRAIFPFSQDLQKQGKITGTSRRGMHFTSCEKFLEWMDVVEGSLTEYAEALSLLKTLPRMLSILRHLRDLVHCSSSGFSGIAKIGEASCDRISYIALCSHIMRLRKDLNTLRIQRYLLSESRTIEKTQPGQNLKAGCFTPEATFRHIVASVFPDEDEQCQELL